MFRSHNVRHISFYPSVLCCQWVLYSSYLPRPKTIIASLAIWDRMSKDVGDPLRADEKFMIQNLSLSYRHLVPTHPSHSWFWSGFERIDAKSALRHICCLKFCLDFFMEVDEFYTGGWFPIVHISRYCAGWNQCNVIKCSRGSQHYPIELHQRV